MPYYAFNLLCGKDEKTGKGVVYGYDAVGSYDTLTYGVQGSGSDLGAPILDNQFIGHNFKDKVLPTDQQEVENTAKDVIHSIAERDIYTGDHVEVTTVDANGVRVIREPIRRDWKEIIVFGPRESQPKFQGESIQDKKSRKNITRTFINSIH